jgi:hypothetical protein
MKARPLVISLVAGLIFLALPIIQAGPFDGLKEKLKAKAQEKIEEKKTEIRQQAEDKVRETVDEVVNGAKNFGLNHAEADAIPPPPPESDPGVAYAPDPSGSAAQSNETLRALPAPNSLRVTLYTATTDSDAGGRPVDPGTEFSSAAKSLFVALAPVEDGQFEFFFNGRIVAENVPGLKPGAIVCQPDNENGSFPTTPSLKIDFPAAPLRPGRYRVELFETSVPYRTFTRVAFSIHDPPMPALGDSVLCTRIETDRQPAADSIGTDFPSRPANLYVAVKAANNEPLRFAARVVVQDVAGLPAGTVLAASDPNTPGRFETDRERDAVDCRIGSIGLPPGTYRAEIVEADRPYRVIKTLPFKTHAEALHAPEFNLADSDFGGLLESVTREEGAGLSNAWRLLDTGNMEDWVLGGAEGDSDITSQLPFEFVVSFYQREPAQVAAVELLSAPEWLEDRVREVEILGSMKSPTDGFMPLGRATAEEAQGRFRISFPSAQARFVKIRILSPRHTTGVHLAGIRVIEGNADNYQPLATRFPELAVWSQQPRHAAQRGLYFLQPNAILWQKKQSCFGCHVQTQTLRAISVARKNDYVLSKAAERMLANSVIECQTKGGLFAESPVEAADSDRSGGATATVSGSLALRYYATTSDLRQKLLAGARALVDKQDPDGSIYVDHRAGPIEDGTIVFVADAIEAWAEALKVKDDPNIRAALARGFAYVAATDTRTTQDKAFKILTFALHGNAEQKKLARELAQELQSLQLPNGAWTIAGDDRDEPSPFATGQALYACYVAGVNPRTAWFLRGVRYLVTTQASNGSWTQVPPFATDFASTLWPVIALTGAFANEVEPAHISVAAVPRPPSLPVAPPPPPVATAAAPTLPKQIELILDCSLSMERGLGKSSRIETAKQVMRDLIARLPSELHVGLRFYGHRYDPMSTASETDTQLVWPIQPLNRAALLKLIDSVRPNGTTPLVYSTLQAARDIKQAGGGVIILVTDGEESCGGKPRVAGPQIAALGVPVRLDIIGFTLTGKRATDNMVAFAGATGGRYYTAANGSQLADALLQATSPSQFAVPVAPPPPPPPADPVPEDFAFEIFNATNEKVAAGRTGNVDSGLDLEPGVYRVVLHDGAKRIELAGLRLQAAQALELRYDPVAGSLASGTGL